MYAKIFRQIYDGTLAEDWRALVTFQQLLILCDDQGNIDMTVGAIQRVTGIPADIIEPGLVKLAQPDPHSRSATDDGRRITLIDESRPWGWHIVNYLYYRNLATLDDKRAKDRERIAAKRRELSQGVADCRKVSPDVADVAHTDTEEDTKADTDVKEKEPGATAPKFSAEDLELAHTMLKDILAMNPDHTLPKIEAWAKSIRLIRERDKRPTQEIQALWRWANNHHFWRANILSPDKLRQQWDKLTAQKINGGTRETHQPIDNSAIGQIRAANDRARQREAAERRANAPTVGTHGDDVRPPLEGEFRTG